MNYSNGQVTRNARDCPTICIQSLILKDQEILVQGISLFHHLSQVVEVVLRLEEDEAGLARIEVGEEERIEITESAWI